MRNYRCKKDESEIAKALTGTWRQEHLLFLEQSLALYDFYTEKISACDTQVEQNYQAICPTWACNEPIENSASPKRLAKNTPKDSSQLCTHLETHLWS